MTTEDFATEGGHWYKADGSPCYTVIGKNGNERATTLRDARTMGLVPSTTGIIRMAAAPQLERWKRNQVLLSALTLPLKTDEPESNWLKRVEQDWQEQGRAAADRGTAIHGAIERFYRGGEFGGEFTNHVTAAVDEIENYCPGQAWSAERSFAHTLGYGGKTDLHSDEWVIDVKTKDGDLSKVEIYDDHTLQLAAYRRGLGVGEARCGILFVSRDAPIAKFVEIEESELVRGLAMFDALLAFWKAKTGYEFKDSIKTKILSDALNLWITHCAALEVEIAPIKLTLNKPDFAGAMKGLEKLSALHDAIATVLANAKIEADAVAKDIRAKLA